LRQGEEANRERGGSAQSPESGKTGRVYETEPVG